MTGRRRRLAIAAALLPSVACEPDSASGAMDLRPAPPLADAAAADAPQPAAEHEPSPEPSRSTALPTTVGSPSGAAQPGDVPIGLRRAQRALMVYVEPRFGSRFRGKIPHGEAFALYELVPGSADEECRGEGWGRIGAAAYVCLRFTEPTEDVPVPIPARLVDGLAPFFYARRKGKDGSPDRPPAPVYRSRRELLAEATPERELTVEHDYLFVERRRVRGQMVLVMPNGRAVRERDVRRLEPSAFEGRDVRARPVPAGTTMAWSVQWPYAIVREDPHPEAAEAGRIGLHAEALTQGEVRVAGGERWVAMAEPAEGWALAEHVRHWVDHEPPAEVRDDEPWIDVDLDQQVLAVRRGAAVEFLTLVSSGTPKHPTPLGLYRIESKWAYADMRSREADAEEYFVEAVPWVLYFQGRYALHGTFWHNRFGRRTSHGCVNLSAHDARWVYERTSPAAKPGWLVINEHARERGTLLRIRKGPRHPPDHRTPPPGA